MQLHALLARDLGFASSSELAEVLTPQQINQKMVEYEFHGFGIEWALLATALINEMRSARSEEYDREKHGTTPQRVIHDVLGR